MKINLAKLMCAFRHRIIPCTFFLFSLFCVGCNFDKNTNFNIEKSIKNTVKKFSYYKDLPSADLYKLDRTVIMEEQGIRLHLHEAISSGYIHSGCNIVYYKHYIVTIVNSKNQGYSIPMFSNEIRAYWNFEFLDVYPTMPMPACHTTFEREFLIAVDSLHLNDNHNTDCKVLYEIMRSLVNYKELVRTSRLFWSTECDYWYDDLECISSLKRSFRAISRGIDPDSIHHEWDVFWDRDIDRICQINYGKDGFTFDEGMKANISIKVYNTACESEDARDDIH